MGLMFVILLSCLSAVMVRGLSNVTVSQEPVKVVVGEDAILGCHLKPPLNATTLGVRWIQEVHWKRNGATVHVYRNQADDLITQDKNFTNRTSLFYDEMATGNISLKLTNVTKHDEGNYTCHVPSPKIQVKRGNVTLIVAELREETNQGNRTSDSEPEPKSEGLRLRTGCGIGAGLLLLLIGGIAIYKHCKRRQTNTTATSTTAAQCSDPKEEQQLMSECKSIQERTQQAKQPIITTRRIQPATNPENPSAISLKTISLSGQ